MLLINKLTLPTKTNSNLIKSQIQKAGIRLGGILKKVFEENKELKR